MEQVRTQEEVRTQETEEKTEQFLKMPKYYLAGVRQPRLAERCDFCGNKINNVVVVHRAGARSYNAGFECIKRLDMTALDKERARNDFKKLKNFISFLEKECRLIVLHGFDCYMYKKFDVEILRQFVHKSMCKDYEHTCSLSILVDVVKDLNTKVFNIDADWQSVEFLREVMKTVNPNVAIVDFGRFDNQKNQRKGILKEVLG